MMIPEKLAEAQNLISQRPKLFILHSWSLMSNGFFTFYLFFMFSSLACSINIPRNQDYMFYILFTAAIVIGGILTSKIGKSFDSCQLLFVCSAVSSLTFWFITSFRTPIFISVSLLCAGLCIGITFATTIITMITSYPHINYYLIHIFLFFYSLGGSVASTIFHLETHEYECEKNFLFADENIPINDRLFLLHPSISLNHICFIYILCQIPLKYVILTSKLDPDEELQRREQYEDIEPEPSSDVPCFKLLVLSSIIAFVATSLHTMFPFLVFSHPKGNLFHYHVFKLSFTFGRLFNILLAAKMAPYFNIGISIIGSGVACSILVFDECLLLGSVILGLFLSAFFPSLILYIKNSLQLQNSTIFLLIIGSTMGFFAFPFLLRFPQSESRTIIAFYFLAIVILVLLYVSMLNIQAQVEKTKGPQDSLKAFIDRFFSGENLLKRTRSIRPFINRLRQSSYKRFRGDRRQMRYRTPTIEITLEPQPNIIE